MTVKGLSHFLFSVRDLDASVEFYKEVFDARLLVKGRKTAYFDLNGMWLALNEEKDAVRKDDSYTHIAFSIDERDYERVHEKLVSLGVRILPGRGRSVQDKRSIYFVDPDGYKFEFHTGSLQDRLNYYRAEKPHMNFFE
ncbi:metallothiol transferase FosB [Bacillus salacetis]|uniref:Metallothiol transferase FosB n=1 Tax=Bacillus salacetis TaxID=2315464 RepID=A0A3A1RA20_9BACI|nr:metallothiol transferase FosB [Bacillus salacetis]RIW37292.1 metallothiol transferase FosB [Bacillus salacetis]